MKFSKGNEFDGIFSNDILCIGNMKYQNGDIYNGNLKNHL